MIGYSGSLAFFKTLVQRLPGILQGSRGKYGHAD